MRVDSGDDEDLHADETLSPPVSEASACVENGIDIPNSKRGLQKFIQSPEVFVVQHWKRKTVEVRERNMTDKELDLFKDAKNKEIRSDIKSHCFKVFPLDSKVGPKNAIGMRWVLIWKTNSDYPDQKKAKARAVILGFQDKSFEYKQTSSPTLSRCGRQTFLLFCAQQHFRVKKGDVSSAFLQGDELQTDMWVIPTGEICQALDIPPGTITKLQRAAYGLVEAPLWWYKTVSSFLSSIGYARLKSDPCI